MPSGYHKPKLLRVWKITSCAALGTKSETVPVDDASWPRDQRKSQRDAVPAVKLRSDLDYPTSRFFNIHMLPCASIKEHTHLCYTFLLFEMNTKHFRAKGLERQVEAVLNCFFNKHLFWPEMFAKLRQ